MIKPTGEIKKCSRSTAYRIASKANKKLSEESTSENANPASEVSLSNSDNDEVSFSSSSSEVLPPPQEDWNDEEPIEVSRNKIWDLPTLDNIGGDDGLEPDEFQGENNREESFIETFKNAEVKQDDEGNQKIHLGEFFVGDNPIVLTILSSSDSALYSWAKNKYEIELWNEQHRAIQRNLFVRTLGMVAPKTAVALSPMTAIYVMCAWLYGLPLVNIFNQIRKKRKLDKRFPKEVLELEREE